MFFLQILLYVLASVLVIYGFHYLYGKKTKHLVTNNSEKYNKIVEEIQQVKLSPFKDDAEKEKMNEELTKFVESQFLTSVEQIDI